MDYKAAEKFILDKLQKELPKHLTYHGFRHSKDVIDTATFIAGEEGIKGEDLILIKTAAAFHDAGFLNGSENHEHNSCELVRLYLPEFGYEKEAIEKICEMIMATDIPQKPKNHLSEILADADLDYLGRDDFFSISNQLFDELKMIGMVFNEDDWNRLQLNFFDAHHYFTLTSIKLRSKKKDENRRQIQSKLNQQK